VHGGNVASGRLLEEVNLVLGVSLVRPLITGIQYEVTLMGVVGEIHKWGAKPFFVFYYLMIIPSNIPTPCFLSLSWSLFC
jgi:hypothetical protein